MKRAIVLISVVSLAILVSGCGKKGENAQLPLESQEVLNEAELLPVEQPASKVTSISEQNLNVAKNIASQEATQSGKPTPKEIQQALKNAGIYQGTVDGVIGPKTKKAIKDFQAQNNLTADGRVGPKTWAALKTFLNQAASASSAPKD